MLALDTMFHQDRLTQELHTDFNLRDGCWEGDAQLAPHGGAAFAQAPLADFRGEGGAPPSPVMLIYNLYEQCMLLRTSSIQELFLLSNDQKIGAGN